LVMERAIAYLRVSTQRQHRSGLGIEAQRSAIERFAASAGRAFGQRVGQGSLAANGRRVD